MAAHELVQPAIQAGKRVQGDLWHVQKNWYNWAEAAINEPRMMWEDAEMRWDRRQRWSSCHVSVAVGAHSSDSPGRLPRALTSWRGDRGGGVEGGEGVSTEIDGGV